MREIEMKRSHGSVRALALFAYISVLITSLSGCKDDKNGPSAHMGKVRLSLSADTTSLKKGIHSSVTKAVSDEFADFLTVDDYRILVVAGTDTAKQYDRFDKMPAEFELPEGTYSLIASKGNNLPAEYENPYFEGSTDFTVKEGMSSPLDVTCSLGNTRIMAEYTDDFKEAYSEYTVLLSSANTTADFEIAKGETRPAYMQVAKDGTDVAVGIRLKKVNAQEEKTYYVPNAIKMERRQNVRLIFKTDGEALEGIGLDVMLDDSLATQSFTTKIPDFMWQQFEKPTLSADGFVDGEKLRVKTTVFDDDLRVGFVMRGGVNSLVVKHWKGDAEDDAEIIDLVAEPEKAKEKYFSWMVNENEFAPLKGTKAGYLILKNAIKSLKADKDKSIEYHYKFYGKDNTGKEYPTNEINLTIIVEPAGAPFIQDFELPSEIVEGDELESMVETILAAEGEINEDKTTLTIESDGKEPSTYHLMKIEDRKAMYETHGIGIEIEAKTKLQMVFLKPFTAFLSALKEGGNRSYTYKLHLEDNNGKAVEVTKTILVKAPVFNLASTEGDAFAKRIILRSDLIEGNKKNLCFQYKEGSNDWSDFPDLKLKPGGESQWVDTLRNLSPDTEYSIRAVYNKERIYKRVSEVKTLKTEIIETIPNGDFEEQWTSRTIGGMTNGANIFVSTVSLTSHTPNYWADVNVKTFSGIRVTFGVLSTYNSVPSTMKNEGKTGSGVRLRTVGWDNGAGNTVSICYHAAAGKLFLGSYSYNHDSNRDTYNYGIPFTSRPSLVKAHYKYSPVKGDSFKAWAVVLNREGGTETVIGRGELVNGDNNSDWTEMSFKINYTDKIKKATHMYIVFSSSAGCSDNESEETNNLKSYLNLGTEVDGFTHHEGSNLYIDNVELIYE